MLRHKPVRRFVVISLFLCDFFISHGKAGVIRLWSLENTQTAPILAVGRIHSVYKRGLVPEGTLKWSAETWEMTANVEILRVYSQPKKDQPAPHELIHLHFLAYGAHFFSVNAFPPPLASVRPGEVCILPLRSNLNPVSGEWELLGNEGVGLTIPARAELPPSERVPATAREFILRELANDLSNGTGEERSSAGGYIHFQAGNLAPQLLPLLESTIGDEDQERWAEIVVNLMGETRPNIEDLRTSGWRDVAWNPFADHGYSIAKIALAKLSNPQTADPLLARAIIARVSFAPEYAAFLAEEYANKDLFAAPLKVALQKGQPGTEYMAWMLIKTGHRAFIAPALQRAAKITNIPMDNETVAQRLDREAAASIIREQSPMPQRP